MTITQIVDDSFIVDYTSDNTVDLSPAEIEKRYQEWFKVKIGPLYPRMLTPPLFAPTPGCKLKMVISIDLPPHVNPFGELKITAQEFLPEDDISIVDELK